jgi:hypothetical protein
MMKNNRVDPRLIHLLPAAALVAGLALASTAQATPAGFTVLNPQEASIKTGMSSAEVRDILGRPARLQKFRNQPGPTFAYHVVGKNDTVFEIDFSADDKVTGSSERIEMKDGNGFSGR